MGFWDCKVCKEKDKRIEDLRERLERLEYYLQPTQADPLPLAMEAQRILDGSLSNVIEIKEPSKDKLTEMQRIKLEEDKMLSGDEIVYE